MKRSPLYVVIDEDGNASFDAKTEKSQLFSTYDRAQKRAKELARCSPGESIRIFALVARACCEIGSAKIDEIES